MKKGQMFIVTMVFLAALMFTVQQILFQYSSIELSEPFRKADVYFLQSVRDSYSDAIRMSSDCEVEAMNSIKELDHYFSTQTFPGYDLSIKYNGQTEPNLNCTNWGSGSPVLSLSLALTNPLIYSETRYYYSSSGLV